MTVEIPIVSLLSIERLTIKELKSELKRTNQRLDEIKILSIEKMEQKLTKQVRRNPQKYIFHMLPSNFQLEEKFRQLMQHQMKEFDQEKYSLVLQISELHHIIHLTQQNLTNLIHQVKKREILV